MFASPCVFGRSTSARRTARPRASSRWCVPGRFSLVVSVLTRPRPVLPACAQVKGVQQTIITDPSNGKEKAFTFDFSYDSFRTDEDKATQMTLWRDIGVGVLTNAYDGYNCSLFAYGQTGAGKSYSMMGYGEDKGIIPIACERMFDRIDANTDPELTIKVETSMLEIYMEKVRVCVSVYVSCA